MHRQILTALLFLCLPWPLLAQTTSLHPDRVFLGDVTELRIVHESEVPAIYSIDTQQLENDFVVLNTRSSVARFLKEGRSMHRMQWSAFLWSKREGRLHIPPLNFGVHQSKALVLTVEPLPAALASRQRIFIETEAEPRQPYPGQQTRVISRLFYNVPLQDPSLSEPETNASAVYRSGREARYQEVRNGETFNVLERSIVVTPATGTHLEIGPAGFSGNLYSRLPAADGSPISGLRRLHRRSPAQRLPLRALPSATDSEVWLPAESVELSLERESSGSRLQVGDSIGLTLTLRARGLSGDLLPEDLLTSNDPTIAIYADRATRRTRVLGAPGAEVLDGVIQQDYAVVLKHPGEIELPAVELAWWDLASESIRMARLAPVQLQVTAMDKSEAGVNFQSSPDSYGDSPLTSAGIELDQNSGWIIAGIIALAVLYWLGRLLVPGIRATMARRSALRDRRHAVEQACARNDARSTHRALIEWHRLLWRDSNISGLAQIARLRAASVSPDAKRWHNELMALDSALFGCDQTPWSGKELSALLRRDRGTFQRRTASTSRRLPELYPKVTASAIDL